MFREIPFQKIYPNSGGSRSYMPQILLTVTHEIKLDSGIYSLPSWLYQDINSNWKPGHLPQAVLFNSDPCNKMSGNFEGFHYISEQVPWNLKEGMHDILNCTSPNLVASVEHKNSHISYNSCNSNEAYLVLRVPPENRFRYRYDTEMSGTHGSLQGIKTGREKSVPTVELVNYPFEALIRVTLVTCHENEHYPHPHSLFVKEKLYQKKVYENWGEKSLTKTGHYCDPHYVRVGSLKNDYTARFEGMCIINSKKENFHSFVKEKLQMRCFELKHCLYRSDSLKPDESENLNRRVEEAVSSVDVDFVSLCFEAFREEDGKLLPICQPVYSEPIGNAKSAKTGKLKISRINKCSGSCKGGDEIWLLVEKINKKGLVVRFSEEYNGKVLWESCIEGDDLILHHQYAIIFKTPPYKDVNITTEIEVLMRLERTTQPNQPCDYSEPITFVYEPSKIRTNKGDNLYRKESILTPLKQLQTKRPRTELPSASFLNHQTKRRTDVLELEGMDFEDSEDDIEQLLFDSKDSFELEQAWGKFNVEEFLRFLSTDDIDVPVQRDGIASSNKSRRDFFYKLYLLYSKLDESDIKKLSDQISNFRVSKKEDSEKRSGVEKDQVKDAASTLLTLRSKAMINNNSNSNDLTMDVAVDSKTDFSGRVLPQSKIEPLHPFLESCCESHLEAQSPVHMSVIRFNLSKSQLLNKAKFGKPLSEPTDGETYHGGDKELFDGKVIKKEKNMSDSLINVDKLDNVCKILNANGSWRNLAELWNCPDAASSAKESGNPAQYIIDYIKQVQGTLECDMLRESLEAVSEKEAVEAFDEMMTQKLTSPTNKVL